MGKFEWLLWVALAGLAWGTYVPIIFYGGNELGGRPNARMMAILCVGLAYFVIGVLVPLGLFFSGQFEWPALKTTGLVFSSLAGVAGAVGAICVIFATSSAMAAGREVGNPQAYRVFIAPLIFGTAPVINVLVSTIWHPAPGNPFHFDFEPPGWKLWVGILLVGIGAGLVLFSKEEAETTKPKAAHAAPPAAAIEPLAKAGEAPSGPEAAAPMPSE
jgi:hypothetical protein